MSTTTTSSGWNRSTSTPKPAPKKPSALRGIIAGLVVVAVASVFVVMFLGKDEKPVEKVEKERGRIKEVTPASAPKAQEAPKPKKKERPRYWEVDASQTNGFTEAMLRKWKFKHEPAPAWTNTAMASAPAPKYAIFGTHAENEIACLLTLQPGESLVGKPIYGERFKNEFLKSCEVPIIVGKDDDEFTAQLKRDMNQTKIELRQRMADGEDLGQILLDSRADIQRLAQVKREIEADMRQMIKEGAQSDADIDMYVEAANKILEQKGAAPLKVSPFIKRALLHSIQKEQTK